MMNILEIHQLSKVFSKRYSTFNVLDKVSFAIPQGSTLALTGESGSGKSTLGKIIMRLESQTSGSIFLNCDGIKKDIRQISAKDYYRKVQMVFQDPYSSLNPSKKIWQIISAPIAAYDSLHQDELFTIAEKYCALVGLDAAYLHVYPGVLSGGQRQRVGIARALVLKPDLLILDEALSALDPSVQAQIVNLLIDVQAELGLTYLFISHDMDMMEHIADEIVIIGVQTAPKSDFSPRFDTPPERSMAST